MASLSHYPQFETNLMSNRKVIELLLQLKSAKAHGKSYIKVKPHLVRHLCVIFYCKGYFFISTVGFLKIIMAHSAVWGYFPIQKQSKSL